MPSLIAPGREHADRSRRRNGRGQLAEGFEERPQRELPVTAVFDPISMIITMIGTAATPLLTAVQNSA